MVKSKGGSIRRHYMRFFCCKGTIFKYLLQIQSFGFSVC